MKIGDNTLKRRSEWARFKRWVKANMNEPDAFDKIDWDALVDRALTFEEASEEVRRLLPAIWVEEDSRPAKKIVFIKPLVEKIRSGEVKATYRNRPLSGLYYVVSNRFKDEVPNILIEFYRSEAVDTSKLTDEEAQLAGIETADKLREMLQRWYGSKPIYRNWFMVKYAD